MAKLVLNTASELHNLTDCRGPLLLRGKGPGSRYEGFWKR